MNKSEKGIRLGQDRRLTRMIFLFLIVIIFTMVTPIFVIVIRGQANLTSYKRFAQRTRFAGQLIDLVDEIAGYRGLVYTLIESETDLMAILPLVEEKQNTISILRKDLFSWIEENPLPFFEEETGDLIILLSQIDLEASQSLKGKESDLWLEELTAVASYINRFVRILYTPETVDESVELMAILAEEALEIVNYAGLERAIVSSLIASEKSPTLQQLTLLERYRGIVEGHSVSLTSARGIEILPDQVQQDLDNFYTAFIVDYQVTRDTVFGQMERNQLISVPLSLWWNQSSHAISMVNKVALSCNAGILTSLDQLQKESADTLLIYTILLALSVLLVLSFALWLLSSLRSKIRQLHDNQIVINDYKNNLESRIKEIVKDQNIIFETAVDAIIVINDKGIILLANPAVKRIFGYDEEEFIGRNISILMPEPHRSHHDEYIRTYLKTGIKKVIGSGREVQAVHKDGRIFPARITIGHSVLDSGNRFIGFIQDISELKAKERELSLARDQAEESSRIKGAFLANMSHEIRTPMNSVLGFLKIALDSGALPGNLTQYIHHAHDSAKGLLGIINDILDVQKLDSGQFKILNICFNLPVVIKESLAMFSEKAAGKHIDLDFYLDKELTHCFSGDPVRLKQILVNLVGNAVKFTAEGYVRLSVEKTGEQGHLSFSVKDSGIGIKPDKLPHIFDSFIQADDSITRSYGGTGLGTTICKQLVELMGGSIGVESVEGVGSNFHFTLPLKPASCSAGCLVNGMTKEAPAMAFERSLRILVAEDVEQNAELLSIRLQEQNHRVVVTENGRKALEEFKKGGFHMILMDVHMPVMDGIAATREIRRLEEDEPSHIPIIALTASVMDEEMQECYDAGMDAVAPKPIDFDGLYGLMKALTVSDRGEESAAVKVTLDGPRKAGLDALEEFLDLETGLERWGSNSQLYLKSLLGFVSDHGKSMEEIRRALEKKDVREIGELCHKIKGAAFNLSLLSLGKAADAATTFINQRDQATPPSEKEWERLKGILEEFITLFDGFESVVEKDILSKKGGETSQRVPAGETQALLNNLRQLRRKISLSEIDSALWDKAYEGLSGMIPEALRRQLVFFIDNYDFDQALQAIDEITAVLEGKVEAE